MKKRGLKTKGEEGEGEGEGEKGTGCENFTYGVWESDLVRDLLWKTVARPTVGQEDLPELPSWTCKFRNLLPTP